MAHGRLAYCEPGSGRCALMRDSQPTGPGEPGISGTEKPTSLGRAGVHRFQIAFPRGARGKGWGPLERENPAAAGVSRWAIQDSNLGPLPYQRSALTD
jgi:hypothetical protein